MLNTTIIDQILYRAQFWVRYCSLLDSRTKPPWTKPTDKTPRTIPRWTKPPDGQNPPPPWTKPPWTNPPPGQNPPGQNPPGQNPPDKPPGQTPPPPS